MFRKLTSLILCMMISLTSFPFQVLGMFPVTAMAADTNVQQNLPIKDNMESVQQVNQSILASTGISGAATLTQDKVEGKYAVKVSIGDIQGKNDISYNLATAASFAWDVNKYSQIKLWIKPDAGAKWIKFSSGVGVVTSDKDGDGQFKVGQDLISGKWNEIILDLTKSSPLLTQGKDLVVTTNDSSTWTYDNISSIYAPIITIDGSSMVNGQTQITSKGIQFKPSASGGFDTNPTVLVPHNVPQAVFSRASVAYNDDGTLAEDNTPRFKSGKFGSGLRVEQYTENLVRNSSFANDGNGDGLPDNYLKAGVGVADLTVSTGTDSNINGKYMRLSHSGDIKAVVDTSNIDSTFKLQPNTKYTLSLKSRKTSTNNSEVWVLNKSGSGNYVQGHLSLITSASTFNKYTYTFTTTADLPANARCDLRFDHNGGGGYADFAEIQLEQKDYATSYLRNDSNTASAFRQAESLSYTLTKALPKRNFGSFWWKPAFSSSQEERLKVLAAIRTTSDIFRYQIGYNRELGKFYFEKNDGSSQTHNHLASAVTSFNAGDNIFVAWADDPNEGHIKLWIGINGGPLSEYSIADTRPIRDAQRIYIGTHITYGGYEANGVFDSVQLMDIDQPNANAIGFNSTFVNNQYIANSSPNIGPEHVLLSNFEGTVDSLECSYNNTSTLPNGKISRVNIDSSYFDATLNQEISTLPKDRLYLKDINPAQFDLSGDGNWVYYNTSTGLNILNLIDGTNKPVAPVTFSPAEVKVNFDGTKVALKDSNKNLYLYDDITKNLKLIASGVTHMAIANDGSLGYSKSTTEGPWVHYVNPSGYTDSLGLGSPSITVHGLDISKDGKNMVYAYSSSTLGFYLVEQMRFVDNKSDRVVTHRVGNSTDGLKSNGNGSMFFYKLGLNWYAYDVANNSAKKLNIDDGTPVKDVTDDNKLLYLDSIGYLLYDCSTDKELDTGIRDEWYTTNSKTNYAINNKGTKMVYTSQTGLKVRNLDGSPRPERYLLSFDGKNSWQTYKNGKWTVVSTENVPTVSDLDQYGMAISEVNGLTEEDFASLYEDGKQIFAFDVAIKFASVDAYVTPALKGITVTFSPNAINANGDQIINSLYTTKNSNEYDAIKWHQIKRIYPIELQPKEAETYYFVYADGIYYNFASNQLTPLSDQSLLSDVESNWIDITLQGLSADQLRNLPTNALNSLLGKKFQVVYAMKVLDVTTEPYSSMITVDYVVQQFAEKGEDVILTISLSGEAPKTYTLKKEAAEKFMQWVNDRQNNKGPVFYRLVTDTDDVFINYYMIIQVKVS